MRNIFLLGWMLSFFGSAACAYAGFSMNEVADENVAIDAQKYLKFQVILNKLEPKINIWVRKEARFTEEDLDSAYTGSIETVEDAWVVPPKVLDRQPTVMIKFKNTSRKELEKFTAQNINKIIAIIVDGEILAAPKGYEPITDGLIQINGNWTADEVIRIVNRINEIAKAKKKG